MEHSIRCLEEQQDEFDFKYQTHLMDCEAAHFILTLSLISLYMVVLMCVCVCVFNVPLACTEEEKKMQVEGLQKMLNALDKCRKVGKFCVHVYSILFYSGLLLLTKHNKLIN